MNYVSVPPSGDDKPSLATLRGAFTWLPDATYQDFLDIKAIWNPSILEVDDPEENSGAG